MLEDDKKDTFSWKKLFMGMFNPLNGAKIITHYFQVAVLIVIVILLVRGFHAAKNYFFPNSAQGTTVSTMNGGHVESGTDRKFQLGLFNR